MQAIQTGLEAATLLVDAAPSGHPRTGAGTVLDAGPDVTRFSPGDLIAWAGVPAGRTSLMLVPEDRALAVPSGLDLPAAAAALVPGLTAHYLAHDTYPATPG